MEVGESVYLVLEALLRYFKEMVVGDRLHLVHETLYGVSDDLVPVLVLVYVV